MTLLPLLLGTALASNLLGLQARGADVPADPTVYATSYVEVMPSARAAAIAALKQYRDASRKQDGYGRLDLFEQIGWPGHFAIFEAWRDQKAFEAHNAAAQKTLLDALQPIRVSGFDQRPYKTLTVARRLRLRPAGRSPWFPTSTCRRILECRRCSGDRPRSVARRTAISDSTSSSTRCAPTISP